MPGRIIMSWRIGSAALPPNAAFHVRRKSCSISPGAMMPEPIVSVAERVLDDWRTARMGLVDDGRAAGVYNAAAGHQALAPGAPSSCCRRTRRIVIARRRPWLARRLRPDLAENRLQQLDGGRERIAVSFYGVGQQPRERGGVFVGQINLHALKVGRLTNAGESWLRN
jgi:hypothetical protein